MLTANRLSYHFFLSSAWPFGLMAYPVIWAPTDDHDKISDPFFSKHPRDIFKVELVKEWVENSTKLLFTFASTPHSHWSWYKEVRDSLMAFGA